MTTATTIPGEIFLLLTNESGRQDSTAYRKQALAAAAIAELVLREKVTLSEERNPEVEIIDSSPTGEPVLDDALSGLSELRRTKIKHVISHREMDLTEVIGEELAAAGAVSRKDGFFTVSWPAQDESIEQALRARLGAAVAEPGRASLQDGIELELLRSLGIAYRILKDDIGGTGRRDLDRTIKGLDIDHPAATALKRVISDMNVVMFAGAAGS